MKKLILLFLSVWFLGFGYSQTAVNWSVNDCDGNAHSLYNELDAGKVVVLCWVMPCSGCIGPAHTASTAIDALGNPNVVLYIVSDYGNDDCSTLVTWCLSNSISYHEIFTNAIIDMSDYGTDGMPKTVVLGGGSAHGVYFNENSTFTESAITSAINLAMPASTGISGIAKNSTGLNIFPTPAKDFTTATFKTKGGKASLSILNLTGQQVFSKDLGVLIAGKSTLDLDLSSLRPGVYFVRLNAGRESYSQRLIILN